MNYYSTFKHKLSYPSAYLAHRKGPENEFSLLIHWLHLVSNPHFFGTDNRGNSKPFLKVALDMTPSLEKIMENYSRRDSSSDLIGALEKVRDALKVSVSGGGSCPWFSHGGDVRCTLLSMIL